MNKAQFEQRFSKVKYLNEQRYDRALQIMKKEVIDILNLVPLLLHYNHPLIPGYRANGVPFGIDLFEPNEFQKEYLLSKGIDPNVKVSGNYPIYALYAMGSTSSIAQGQDSDLDIWVCISKDTPFHEQNLLAEKCRFVSSFAKAKGAEVNLFVTAENRFISGDHGTMDTEDCGSAQSLFLLDEFFRSSIRLCGRYISWYMVSVEEEKENYSKYLNEFLQNDFVDKKQWFDFGSVAKCSPVEYFGSGLWLVYKGIDHPFKAVLKILLMEAYAFEYPNTYLLSMALKDAMFKTNIYSLQLDAYYLMYKKVERFLVQIKDEDRLRLAKACFFMKVKSSTYHLSKCNALNRRLKFLDRLTKLWSWTQLYVDYISSKDKWDISNINKIQNIMFASLLKSYKALLRFSVEHGIESAITSDDAGVLSRKIYAAYDRYPGKIMLSNKDALYLLEEETLTFVKSADNSVCRQGWHVFPTALTSIDMLSSKAVYIAPRAVEIVAWATLNNVLTQRTEVFVAPKSTSVDKEKVKKLSVDILSFLRPKEQHINESDLQKPRTIIKSMVVLNFAKDITQNFLISNSDLELGSVLSCGRQKMCLVGSVDVINLNSWGEVTCHSYSDGENGVVELLASLVRTQSAQTFKATKDLTSTIKICSYSKVHSDLIRFDLESTVRSIFACFNDYESNHLFNVGTNSYEALVDDENNDISIIRKSMFRASDYDATILSRFGMRPEYALQVPSSVERHATLGVMQYFFSKEGKGWNIYIVNERNELKTYYGFVGSRAALVNTINRFYTSLSDNLEHKSILNFNLPQYFVLSKDLKSIHPFTISMSSS